MKSKKKKAEPIRLGILDMGWCSRGKTRKTVLKETILLAAQADRLGFSRYWLTEHRTPNVAWVNPEPLIAAIAENTKKITIGPAGVLLGFRDPERVFHDYSLLNQLYPGRIELGLANAIYGGKAPKSKRARNAWFAKAVSNLMEQVRSDPKAIPAIWLLGSNSFSLELAEKWGLPYSHSLIHGSYSAQHSKEAVSRKLIELFERKPWDKTPRLCITAGGLCLGRRGKPPESTLELPMLMTLAGSDKDWLALFQQFQIRYRCDDFMFYDSSTRLEDRLETMERLARVLKLRQCRSDV